MKLIILSLALSASFSNAAVLNFSTLLDGNGDNLMVDAGPQFFTTTIGGVSVDLTIELSSSGGTVNLTNDSGSFFLQHPGTGSSATFTVAVTNYNADITLNNSNLNTTTTGAGIVSQETLSLSSSSTITNDGGTQVIPSSNAGVGGGTANIVGAVTSYTTDEGTLGTGQTFANFQSVVVFDAENDISFTYGVTGNAGGGERFVVDITPTTPIPEPSSLILLGLGGFGFLVRRKR